MKENISYVVGPEIILESHNFVAQRTNCYAMEFLMNRVYVILYLTVKTGFTSVQTVFTSL